MGKQARMSTTVEIFPHGMPFEYAIPSGAREGHGGQETASSTGQHPNSVTVRRHSPAVQRAAAIRCNSIVGSVTDLISIVDADPDLADLLDPAECERARREALTRVRHLSVGTWDVTGAVEPDVHHRGFMLISGLLSREVNVLERTCVELLGVGDVLRPWQWDEEGSHVHAEVGWERARAHRSRGARPRSRRADEPVARARSRAVRARDAARARDGHLAGHRPPSAGRRSPDPDPLASGRALGSRAAGGDRRAAAALPPAPGASGRCAPALGHDRDR